MFEQHEMYKQKVSMNGNATNVPRNCQANEAVKNLHATFVTSLSCLVTYT